MANLQKALDEARVEVEDLDKRRAGLTQDITSLTSKRRFLTATVGDLKRSNAEAQKEHSTALKRYEDELSIVRNDIAEARKELKMLTGRIEVAQSEMETLRKNIEEEITKLDKQLQDKKNEIAEAEKLKQLRLEEVEEVAERIREERGKLTDFTEQVRKADTETASKIAAIQATIKPAEAVITAINRKIDKKAEQHKDLETQIAIKLSELAETSKKHEDYLKYEKRADMALKARESALLEGESRLAIDKRRRGVLDNLR